jgi:autotransporter adhesin
MTANGVNLDIFGRGEAAIHVSYASNSDDGGEPQRNVAMC